MSDDNERNVEEDKKKTKELIPELKKFFTSKDGNTNDLIQTLEDTPEMLQFEEYSNRQLVITIHSSVGRAFQLFNKNNICNNTSSIKNMLQRYYIINKPQGINSVVFNYSRNVNELCRYENTNLSGGSKSRRKPARKTHRGRIRKSKPKTHRRRHARHSRTHKHKKYTRKH
jgi:hypothetical protein